MRDPLLLVEYARMHARSARSGSMVAAMLYVRDKERERALFRAYWAGVGLAFFLIWAGMQ